ncbi:IBR domain, a half RING-finger domain-containing protein [Hirsutella rhossiliensis]|uniref:IBR domain, a half RING-finger domain-containing protein n=1 Tax=Hirsutella rhossiliensis TaxID=111463 RepID=A0A9P8N279_9HYPO|nr:IBR domain, a half RING-finger domain-containing protein [Hirsutella rhossiliensis]KAH0965530.1 IBR domain, a half RING-finger domain-containing protein [Hirsutella rhossiliensis]
MVFSGLLSSSSSDRSPASSRTKPRPAPLPLSSSSSSSEQQQHRRPEFIHDEAQLPCIPPERPDLRDLNSSLEALAAVFPDVQIEVFRELLSSFDGESRLALVADALLKNRVAWVKGRWRTVADRGSDPATPLSRTDVFRSPEYIRAVRSLAWLEFRGLSRSTINAVLAESNHAYLDARRTLVSLSSKSWRFTISSLFLRRKPIGTGEAENHPLVVWRSTGHGSIFPAVRSTGSAELDRELYDTLVRPLKERDREEREAADRGLAVRLNHDEAERAGATHECTCCFVGAPFEEFTSCNQAGHMICVRCVRHSIKEALFGQAWLSSINTDTGTLKCLAVEGDGCAGYVPSDHLHRALMEDREGADMLHKLDQRLAEQGLVASALPLIHCPFCSYIEVDDVCVPLSGRRPRLRVDNAYGLVLLVCCAAMLILSFPVALLSSLACILVSSNQSLWRRLSSEWNKALNRHCRRRRGLRFSCQNPRCKRVSCLSCHKSWADIHVCNESSLVALRTQVEQAMSLAIKRVCPRCNTSFVKNAGCNKLTCPCGYKMCYVCRADLGDEGYRHFCDHFRPDGDPRPCRDCDRCNLWEAEDVDRVLDQARSEAERAWREREHRDLSGAEKAYLETGVAQQRGRGERFRGRGAGGLTFADLLDFVVDALYA